MFTGLIEEVGSVIAVGTSKNGNQLKIAAPHVAKKIRRGDSLAVNGCCLTLNSHRGEELVFDLLDETIARTNLKNLQRRQPVNLERAVSGRAIWGTFRSRAHRLCLARHRLSEKRRRFSIGNRVTKGVRPLCREQGLDCSEWNQSYCRRSPFENVCRVDYSLHENAYQFGPDPSGRSNESRVRYSRQVR